MLRLEVIDEGDNVFLCVNDPKSVPVREVSYLLSIYDILLFVHQATSQRDTEEA